ncbi:Mediator of RNA polymerase II transcription subunit 29 [Halotydeus destructor]|nr:Mediator of RNA polymerase II transcription subunit 29 [Halotydeus destructor]
MLGGGGPPMVGQQGQGMPQGQQMLQHQLMGQGGQQHPGMGQQMPSGQSMGQGPRPGMMAQMPGQQMQRPPEPHGPRVDYVAKVRSLVSQLKESLHGLMRMAAMDIDQNLTSDNQVKEEKMSRFDKSLEEFFSITNQIEMYLKTISECVTQQRDSHKYIPFQVNQNDHNGQVDRNNLSSDVPIPYGYYQDIVKGQIHFTKAVQQILLDGAQAISHSDQSQGQMMTQPGMQQPQTPQLPPNQGQ